MEYRNEFGELHRDDGPAIETSIGVKAWYRHGEFHRVGGPAIEYPNGYRAWYINGKEITRDVDQWLLDQKIMLPMNESELSFFIMTFVGE